MHFVPASRPGLTSAKDALAMLRIFLICWTTTKYISLCISISLLWCCYVLLWLLEPNARSAYHVCKVRRVIMVGAPILLMIMLQCIPQRPGGIGVKVHHW